MSKAFQLFHGFLTITLGVLLAVELGGKSIPNEAPWFEHKTQKTSHPILVPAPANYVSPANKPTPPVEEEVAAEPFWVVTEEEMARREDGTWPNLTIWWESSTRPSGPWSEELTPLHLAIWSRSNTQWIDRLADHTDLSAYSSSGFTPLLLACRDGDMEVVKILLSKGADVNQREAGGWNCTPLQLAAYYGRAEVCRTLVENGATLGLGGFLNQTEIAYAAKGGHLETVKLLVELGADIESVVKGGPPRNGRGRDRGNMLHDLPKFNPPTEIYAYFIDLGADLNQLDDLGWSPLVTAVQFSDGFMTNTEAIKLLLDSGADPNFGAPLHVVACHTNENRNVAEICNMLLDAGADPTIPNSEGEYPIDFLLNRNESWMLPIDDAKLQPLLKRMAVGAPPEVVNDD